MQEPFPSFIPPGAFNGESRLYDPNGPVGQIVDAFSESRMTIGQQALSEYPPMHGWYVTGEFGHFYAVPDLQPPPAAQFAMVAAAYDTMAAQNYAVMQQVQNNKNAHFMAAFLMVMF